MPAPSRRISLFMMFLSLLLIAISMGLAYRGYSFYKLSVEDRVEHPDFRTLRPTGLLGNGYGWVAAMLVVLNLAYLIRRRFGGARLGSMQKWLDVHVFTGLLAAVLVSFHSAFQIRTPIAATSTVSLGLVVVTGIIGRFLFALAPAGSRERLVSALDGADASMPGSRPALADALSKHPGPNVPANASLLDSLVAIPRWMRAASQRRRAIAEVTPPRKQQTRMQRLAIRELEAAAALDARASGVSALLRTWRGLHRLFALLMLAAVLLHGGVAWYYGYRWIFT
ncbi:MAG TPA: hypothetical protein VLB44_01690 [Kofleriaceae bacterium]|nr:hypothetical protein [Kofleriaceae bacterium]